MNIEERGYIMKKPIIAVTALFDDEKESIWMLPAYLNAITDAGGIPVILPLIDNEEDIKNLAYRFDGFLLTGGQDINPKIYNEKKKTIVDILIQQEILWKLFCLEKS